jgi:tRNA threonylcarbamoyladenosine biosynthesis protein TsaE
MTEIGNIGMKAPDSIDLFLADEQSTLGLGRKLANSLAPGMLVTLRGSLGAGKTTLARGILRGLGFEGRVKSPTYSLVELYELSRLDLYHFDFYRFEDPHELIESGLQDAFNEANLCIVEWPERAESLLPIADLEVALSMTDSGRNAVVTAQTENGKHCLRQLQT